MTTHLPTGGFWVRQDNPSDEGGWSPPETPLGVTGDLSYSLPIGVLMSVNPEAAVIFVETMESECVSGEKARYLVGAGCPKLAFFYALGGEFINQHLKMFRNDFGTHIVFDGEDFVWNLSEMTVPELKQVEDLLPRLDEVFV